MPDSNTLAERLTRYADAAMVNGFVDWAYAMREAADRIESLEAALRQPDRTARIIRNVAEWTPEMRGKLVAEITKRWPEDREESCVVCGDVLIIEGYEPRCDSCESAYQDGERLERDE